MWLWPGAQGNNFLAVFALVVWLRPLRGHETMTHQAASHPESDRGRATSSDEGKSPPFDRGFPMGDQSAELQAEVRSLARLEMGRGQRPDLPGCLPHSGTVSDPPEVIRAAARQLGALLPKDGGAMTPARVLQRVRQRAESFVGKLQVGTMQLILGSAGVSPVVFGVPPKTFARRTNAPFGAVCHAPRPVGETPTGATGTVALPVSFESFRLEVP